MIAAIKISTRAVTEIRYLELPFLANFSPFHRPPPLYRLKMLLSPSSILCVSRELVEARNKPVEPEAQGAAGGGRALTDANGIRPLP